MSDLENYKDSENEMAVPHPNYNNNQNNQNNQNIKRGRNSDSDDYKKHNNSRFINLPQVVVYTSSNVVRRRSSTNPKKNDKRSMSGMVKDWREEGVLNHSLTGVQTRSMTQASSTAENMNSSSENPDEETSNSGSEKSNYCSNRTDNKKDCSRATSAKTKKDRRSLNGMVKEWQEEGMLDPEAKPGVQTRSMTQPPATSTATPNIELHGTINNQDTGNDDDNDNDFTTAASSKGNNVTNDIECSEDDKPCRRQPKRRKPRHTSRVAAIPRSAQTNTPLENNNFTWFLEKFSFCPEVSTRDIPPNLRYLIYVDGSAFSEDNSAAAAVVVRHVPSGKCHVIASFCPEATNEMAEWIAMITALKIAKTLLNHGPVLILGDSNNVYLGTTGVRKKGKNEYGKFCAMATNLYTDIANQIVIARIAGHIEGSSKSFNLADTAAKYIRSNEINFASFCARCETSLILEMPDDVRTKRESHLCFGDHDSPLAIAENIMPNWERKVVKTYNLNLQRQLNDATTTCRYVPTHNIESLQDYLRLRSLPARNYVPPNLRTQWAAKVQRAITAVVTASAQPERDNAMLALMVLPNLWLPSNVSTNRVQHHLRQDVPFSTTPKNKLHKTKNSVSGSDRLQQAVARKARDYDLKGAINLLKGQAELGKDMSYENKCREVRTKMVDLKFGRSPNGDLCELKQAPENTLPDIASSMGTPEPTVSPSTAALKNTLRGIKRTAAHAIDGWSRNLLDFVLEQFDQQVAENFVQILMWVTKGEFGPMVRRCLLATRIVPIPKLDNSVRPISVSHFFLKLAGGMALKDGPDRLREWQFADTGNIAGAKKIIHCCRSLLKQGKTIAKFDLRNAYGEMPRALCATAVLTAKSPMLAEYFKTVYLNKSDGVIFGPEGKMDIVELMEGVRQGDATSAYIFCRALDIIITDIVKTCREKTDIEIPTDRIFCFMDDLTIALESAIEAKKVAKIVKEVLKTYGLEVNESSEKSSAITAQTLPTSSQPSYPSSCSPPSSSLAACDQTYPVRNHDEPFELLGGSLSTDTTSFYNKQFQKQEKFFQMLGGIYIHPALVVSILRLCGNPRIRYICCVMPPDEKLQTLAGWFDERVVAILDSADLLHGRLQNDVAAKDLLWNREEGLGFTRYQLMASQLYHATAAEMNVSPRGKRLEPATTDIDSAGRDPEGNYGHGMVRNGWLFYTGRSDDLTPPVYKIALCARLGMLHEKVTYPITCECGIVIENDTEFIKHTLCCSQGKFTAKTGANYIRRHDTVKNEALVAIPRMYGIPCTPEPDIYGMYYNPDLDTKRRPDVEYHTVARHLAIDLSIVYPEEEAIEGNRARAKANEKVKAHSKAVEAVGHIFAPFIMETTGYLHPDAIQVIKFLKNQLQPWLRPFFHRDIMRALSMSLTKQKVEAIVQAVQKQRCSLFPPS